MTQASGPGRECNRKARKSWVETERQLQGWLDADSVVHRVPQPLLTSQILLSRLDGDVTQKELDLVEFSASLMAQPRDVSHAAGPNFIEQRSVFHGWITPSGDISAPIHPPPLSL